MKTFKSFLVFLCLVCALLVKAETTIKIPGYNGPLQALRFFDDSHGFLSATEGKIGRTLDGGSSWELIETGYINQYFKAIEFINESVGFAVGSNGFIIKTNDGGNSWVQLPLFTNNDLRNVRYFNNWLYVVGSSGTRWKSSNSGLTWVDFSIPGYWDHFNDISFVSGEIGYLISPIDQPAFWKSTNAGVNWVGFSLPNNIQAFAIHCTQNFDFIVGMSSNLEPRILRSSNQGIGWQITNIPDGIVLTGITFSDQNTGFVIGGNWQTKVSRIYKTTNSGGSWDLIDEKLNTELYSIDCTNNSVFITGDSGTIYRSDISVGINQLSSFVPEGYDLSQNYPNPFNPTTNINFTIPNPGPVSLVVYDIAGKEVTTLVNEKLNPGSYEYQFDAHNLPSGTYLYRLITGDYTETKKMMLIK